MDSRPGRGVQVVSAGHQSFALDEKALKKILKRHDVRDRSVVLISVAGAFRKGKSFLLGFFLRYLHYKYNLRRNGDDWLGSEDETLSGFSWRGGSERETSGLLFWSQPFKATLDNGEKVVIFLMDTQGTFDSGSTVRDDATMFALSTMLSSVQIYNLSQNLAANDLQYLQLFTEYGRLAQQTVPGPPFQRLQILIRDWSFPYEHQYGAEGGRELLEKRLKLHDGQHSEIQLVRNHIKNCFQELTCFLMPHPGFIVSTDPKFNGRLSDISQEFKFCLMHLVPMLLAPENLIVKRIGGQKIKSRDLLLYFKSYVHIFNGTSLPEPKTIYDATTEANNLLAMASAKKVYQTLMEKKAGRSKPYLDPKDLQKEYHCILDKALHVFRTKRKMGGEQIAKIYSAKLVQELEGQYEQCRLRNEDKKRLRPSAAGVLLALALLGYLVALLAYLLGLESLQTFGKLTALAFLTTLILWIYTRVTGNARGLGMQLDHLAEYICVHVLGRRI